MLKLFGGELVAHDGRAVFDLIKITVPARVGANWRVKVRSWFAALAGRRHRHICPTYLGGRGSM